TGEDPAFAMDALAFGERMMREGNQRGQMREWVYWSAIDYSVGQGAFSRAWKQLYPEQPLPAQAAESYRKFFRDNPGYERSVATWDQMTNPRMPCPRKEFEE